MRASTWERMIRIMAGAWPGGIPKLPHAWQFTLYVRKFSFQAIDPQRIV